MLQAIRSHASGIVVQILFGVLILTFALWGIGDIFRGRDTDTSVASVGDVKIDATEVARALRLQVDRFRQAMNTSLTEEQIKQLGLLDTTLNQVIDEHLLDLEAERLGLAVNDNAVRQAIVTNPAFRGPSGTFDRNVYAQLLGANQMTDQQYEAILRTGMIRSRIIDSVTAGADAPPALIDALWQSRGERRIAEALLIPPSAIGTIPTPDGATLDKFYDAHKDQFMLPERRSFTLAMVDPSQFLAGIKVPDDELQAAYKKRTEEFVVPEKRTVQQILVPDEAKAKAAAAALAAGKDFAAVAKNIAGETPDQLNLGALSQAEMPGDLGKAVFDLKLNQVTKPINDPFGWHIAKLLAIAPETVQPFAQVKDKLQTELARDQAADQVAKTANAVDDALAGGASFKDVVAKFSLKTVTADSVDEQGHDAAGKTVTLPQPSADILKTAFATATGQPSDLKELADQGYYMVSVDKVLPASPQPLAQIKDKVAAAWQQSERAVRLAELGDDLAAAANKGQKLDDVAALHGLKTFITKPLSRYNQDADLPPAIMAKLFSAKQGQAVSAADADKGDMVAMVTQVLPPDPKDAATQKAQIAREIAQSTKGDLLAEYEQALRQRYPVTVNRDALDRLL
jgi:peptidyl-prolyl cis-trans isomerase D